MNNSETSSLSGRLIAGQEGEEGTDRRIQPGWVGHMPTGFSCLLAFKVRHLMHGVSHQVKEGCRDQDKRSKAYFRLLWVDGRVPVGGLGGNTEKKKSMGERAAGVGEQKKQKIDAFTPTLTRGKGEETVPRTRGEGSRQSIHERRACREKGR